MNIYNNRRWHTKALQPGYTTDSNTAWAAPVGYVQDHVQEQIAAFLMSTWMDTPKIMDQAVAGYLPLTGGDLTGVLNIDRPSNPALVISG